PPAANERQLRRRAGPTIPAFLYRPPAVNERQFAPAAARNDGSRAAPGGSRRLLLDRRPSRFVVFPGGGATFPTGHEAEGGRHQRADPADEDRSPAAGDVGQPAEDRASDRGRADEEDGLDGEDPADHRLGGAGRHVGDAAAAGDGGDEDGDRDVGYGGEDEHRHSQPDGAERHRADRDRRPPGDDHRPDQRSGAEGGVDEGEGAVGAPEPLLDQQREDDVEVVAQHP